ncbi:hypothetical protein A3Q56_08576 [Intoshia linei]|uniref:Uncharacterized protein n=1 Tax=Intoshia linei TaxID=1819745 RepID=A0A177ANX3_9BILA|nr:hypothetical protein A3Q56_08576 [Intoshia linei]
MITEMCTGVSECYGNNTCSLRVADLLTNLRGTTDTMVTNCGKNGIKKLQGMMRHFLFAICITHFYIIKRDKAEVGEGVIIEEPFDKCIYTGEKMPVNSTISVKVRS